MEIVLGLTAGNFIFQAMTGHNNWSLAAQLSFMQAVAVYAYHRSIKGRLNN